MTKPQRTTNGLPVVSDDSASLCPGTATGSAEATQPPGMLMSAEQAIERLGLTGIKSPRWLKDQARSERIPVSRVGKTLMWSERDLYELVELLHAEPRSRPRRTRG